MTTVELIHTALASVHDPELHRSLPELGMVKSVEVTGSTAKLEILLTISGCPMRDRLQKDITEAVIAVPEIAAVEISFGVMDEAQRANIKKLLRNGRESFISFAQKDSLTRVIGVASGKGGVGKWAERVTGRHSRRGCIRPFDSPFDGTHRTTSYCN